MTATDDPKTLLLRIRQEHEVKFRSPLDTLFSEQLSMERQERSPFRIPGQAYAMPVDMCCVFTFHQLLFLFLLLLLVLLLSVYHLHTPVIHYFITRMAI